MEVFKTRWFARFARQERIADSSLQEAIERAEGGLIDADLGGGLIKQRVARSGQGRSGGYRVIVAYRFKHRAVFIVGFAKSEQENLEPTFGGAQTGCEMAGSQFRTTRPSNRRT